MRKFVCYGLSVLFLIVVIQGLLPDSDRPLTPASVGFGLCLSLFFFWLGWRRGRKKTAMDRKMKNDSRVTVISSSAKASSSDEKESSFYKAYYYAYMKTLGGFTKQDIDRIYLMLKGSDTGEIQMRYSPEAVVAAEFADRQWTWPEMDEWEKIFIQAKYFPAGWHSWWNASDLESLNIEKLCNMLKVEQIRDILTSLDVPVPAKSKKSDLVKLLEEKSTFQEVTEAMPEWTNMIRERKRERSKARGRELLEIIRARAGSQHLKQAFTSLKRKTTLIISSPNDEIYIKKALALNPQAVPPFFPGDRSRYTV